MAFEKRIRNNRTQYRVDIWKNDRRIKRSPWFDKKTMAEKWETVFKDKVLNEQLGIVNNDVPIMKPLEDFFKEFKGKGKEYRREIFATLLQFLEVHKISKPCEMTAQMLRAYIRNSDDAPMTLKRKVTYLKRFGRFLKREKYASENVFEDVQNPRGKTVKNKRPLSPDELKKILDVCRREAPVFENIINFAALTGMRMGEILTLEWKNIDFEKGFIYLVDKPDLKFSGIPFKCKKGSSRIVPISKGCFDLLMSIRQKHSHAHDFVFVNTDGNRYKWKISSKLRNIFDLSGVDNHKDNSLHSMRHTFISTGLANGIDIPSMMKYAGHQQMETTAWYTKFVGDEEKMKRDSEKFFKIPPPIHPQKEFSINSV